MSRRYDATSYYDSDRAPEDWHLIRKVLLLFLLVLAFSLGLVFILREKPAFPSVLFNIFADASIGLIAGLGTRVVLHRPPWIVKAIVSAAMSLVGLVVLGYLTDWRSGIGPIQLALVPVQWLDWAHVALKLPLQLGRSSMDLLDLAHAAIAVDTSWIVLRAWARGPRVTGQRRAPASRQALRPAVGSVQRPVVSSVQRPAVSRPTPAARVRVPSRSAGVTSIRPRTRPRSLVRRPVVSKSSSARPARVARRWNPLRRRSAVQLAVYEEHRCPYCLQEVSRNDPRGTVECPICHTLHHKDCWDITGTCQVPHLNN